MRHRYLSGNSAVKIVEAVERAIIDGRLVEGERIESIRAAAELLGVNRNTVARAYERLRDRGILIASGGRGGMHVARQAGVETRAAHFAAEVCDLASGNVDPHFLPDLAPALMTVGQPPTGYDVAGDDPDFVAFVRERLSSEGLDADHLFIASGALDAIERTLRAQVRPGATVLVEDPGYPPHLDLVRSLGFRLRPLMLDDEGPVPAALEEGLAAGAQAVLLTPRAQNPFGCDISAERATELRRILDQHPDVMLVLDDHWGPLAEGAVTMMPGASRRWLLVRSVSKFLGPDLRVAVTIGDATSVARVQRQFGLGPRWVSGLLQRTAHRLWATEETAALMVAAKRAYAERRGLLLQALDQRGVVAHGSSGIHLWIPVRSEASAAQALLARGWAVQPGEPFRLASDPAIRLSLGALSVDRIEALADDVAASIAMKPGPRA